jgi:hypothetical protein
MSKKYVLQFMVFVAVTMTPSLAVFAAQVCTPKERTFMSDEDLSIVGGGHAVSAYSESPLWTKTIPGTWVWNSFFVQDPNQTEKVTFLLQTNLPQEIASSTLEIAADDYYKVFVNGQEIGSEFGENNFLTDNVHVYHPTEFLKLGENTLSFEVTNAPYFYSGDGTVYNNPAGLLFQFSVFYNECTISPDVNNGGAVPLSYIRTEVEKTPSVTKTNNDTFPKSVQAVLVPDTEDTTSVSSGVVSDTVSNLMGQDDSIKDKTETITPEMAIKNEKKNGLAAAFFGIPEAFLGKIKCILLALIFFLFALVVWQLFIKKNMNEPDPLRLRRKEMIFLALSSISIIILLPIFGFPCAIIPFTIIATVALIFLMTPLSTGLKK